MTEGFKGTLVGGIVGLLLVGLGMLIVYRVVSIKPDWVVAVCVPIMLAIAGWYITYVNRVKNDMITKIESKVEQKEMNERFNWLDGKIDKHVDVDNSRYEDLSKSNKQQTEMIFKIWEHLNR